MSFQQTSLIRVFFIRGEEKIFMGSLVYKNRTIYFEYAPEFLATKLELSPFKLPLKPGVQVCEDSPFEGLFGVFNDSLPDGWGRLLLDRKLMQLGVNPAALSPLDRLHYVGSHGMGALTYEPETPLHHPHDPIDLDEVAEEVVQFQKDDAEEFLDDLLAMNGSSAGARPKILINIDHEDWIIKFRSSIDPKDIGPIEYAYHLMAQEAKIEVPEARLFHSKTGPGYFGVKRFDRIHGTRLHMHALSGLLHADHRIPCLDYSTILKATLWLTKDAREGEKQFKAAIFNVLSHNRDDHAKNFSFLMSPLGAWRVSPAYDLTFSSGPGGEHCTMMMGEGKNPSMIHFLELAKLANIDKNRALFIIEEVQQATVQWKHFAKEAGVSKTSMLMIQKSLQ